MVKNIETGLKFYDSLNEKIIPDIWNELDNGLWRNFSIDNYLYNDTLAPVNLNRIKPLFSRFQQIVPGTYWNLFKNNLELDLYIPIFNSKNTFNDFVSTAELYFNSLNAKKIGVHLSGGLDSSLIIGLLHYLKIPFVPIGLKSNSFEFRTERKIQEILIEWGDDGLLLDMEEYPYYSQLADIPKHQIPDDDIKSIAGSKAIAKAFAERNCDVVLSGQGGDTLFVEEILDLSKISFNIGNEFLNPTEQDRIYEPLNIKLEAFYADTNIINAICSARLGQKTDPLKKWARNWAKEVLPKELSEFSYCADFFGQTMNGLNEAKSVIKDLMEEAYAFTSNQYFSPKNIKKFINQDVFSFEFQDYIRYCGLISIASWFHSLFNN